MWWVSIMNIVKKTNVLYLQTTKPIQQGPRHLLVPILFVDSFQGASIPHSLDSIL